MMNPRRGSNFASSARAPRMNLRAHSGPAFPALPPLHSQSLLAFRLRLAPPANCLHRLILLRVPDRNRCPNSLRGHQLIETMNLIDLWKQVQILESSVDITIHGAFTLKCWA